MFKHNSISFSSLEIMKQIANDSPNTQESHVANAMIDAYEQIIRYGMIGEYTDYGDNDPIEFALDWDLL